MEVEGAREEAERVEGTRVAEAARVFEVLVEEERGATAAVLDDGEGPRTEEDEEADEGAAPAATTRERPRAVELAAVVLANSCCWGMDD